jgi:hypothetical protein
VAATVPLTAALETLLSYAPLEAAGFTLRRLGTLPETIFDAAAADLDGDGVTEVAALSSTSLSIVRPRASSLDRVASAAIPGNGRRRVRDARGIVAVQGQTIHTSLAGAPKGADFGFSDSTLTSAGARSDTIVMSALGRRVASSFAEDTNWLGPELRVVSGRRRGTRTYKVGTFYALKAGPKGQLALLDTSHTLHLLDKRLKKTQVTVQNCGAGFAVADFVGDDGQAEVLCSNTTPALEPDHVRLIAPGSGRVLWTSPPLPGGVRAIALLPGDGPPSALLFVDNGTRGGSTVWWLRRGY